MIEKKTIEVEQFVDADEPIRLTFVPSGTGGFLLVSEDPSEFWIRMVDVKEKNRLTKRWWKEEKNDAT